MARRFLPPVNCEGATRGDLLARLLLKITVSVSSPVFLIACLSCLPSFGQQLHEEFAAGIPKYAQRLRYPGPSKHPLMEVLKRLREGYVESNAVFENVHVKGRLSHVTAKWKPGSPDLTREGMPRAQWKDFTLILKDGKKRFEKGYSQPTSTGPLEMTVYRLFDGKSIYKLDGTALAIDKGAEVDRHWVMNSAFSFYQCELVRFATDWCSVPDYLQKMSELFEGRLGLSNGREFFEWSGGSLQCWREDRHVVLQFDQDSSGTERQAVWIDPQQGFRMVKERVESGRRENGLYTLEQRDITNMEVAPGTFFPKRATTFAATLGKGPERDGGAGWVKRELEVQSVEFGDFEVSPELFDPDSLPIPIGANVTDRRGIKPISFVYGKLPISEQVLASALDGRPESTRAWRTWLIGANVLVCILLVALTFRKAMTRS